MNILLIQRDGVDLHHTLFASETSRMALRFYHPKKKSCGVYITVSTLGSALSLVSELRWYIRRYVKETLFEVTPGIFCTRTLAQDVYYERTTVLGTGVAIPPALRVPPGKTDQQGRDVTGINYRRISPGICRY